MSPPFCTHRVDIEKGAAHSIQGDVHIFKGKMLPRQSSTCGIGVTIFFWYLCSIVGNNAGKSVLSRIPLPMTLCVIQFTLATFSVTLLNLASGRKSLAQLWSILQRAKYVGALLGSMGIISNVSHRVALMYIPVSFAHTVKATQPLFSAVLSSILLGQSFSWTTVLSLLVVVAGVALAAFTEFQFNTIGFIAAEASAMAMSVANVSLKRVLHLSRNELPSGKSSRKSYNRSSHFDKNDMFLIVNAFSLALVLPVWWFAEVPRLGLTTFTPMSTFLVFLNTGTMTLQHFLALSILAAISPVSHSIVNSCKRVVVITVSVLYFGNPVSVLNAAGIVVTLSGIFLYERSVRVSSPQPRLAPSSSDTALQVQELLMDRHPPQEITVVAAQDHSTPS